MDLRPRQPCGQTSLPKAQRIFAILFDDRAELVEQIPSASWLAKLPQKFRLLCDLPIAALDDLLRLFRRPFPEATPGFHAERTELYTIPQKVLRLVIVRELAKQEVVNGVHKIDADKVHIFQRADGRHPQSERQPRNSIHIFR